MSRTTQSRNDSRNNDVQKRYQRELDRYQKQLEKIQRIQDAKKKAA